MADYGYIKLHRSILNWEWYTDANTVRVFLHLLLSANHKDGRWRGQEVKRGQVITSYAKLAAALQLSVQNVRTAIAHLERTGEVTYAGRSQYSVITMNHYERYQQLTSRPTGEVAVASHGADMGLTTNKKDENDKKFKEMQEDLTAAVADVVESYHAICVSYPRCRKLSDARRKEISERLKAGYTPQDFKRLFVKAEASAFLKGKNARAWQASFDWLLREENMAKTLDGNYDDYAAQGKQGAASERYDYSKDEDIFDVMRKGL